MHSCELVPRIILSYFNHMGDIAELKRKRSIVGTSCDLVPRIIHSYFGHLGGVAEVKRKNQADHARPA